jgi:hypothetical protein
MNRVPDVLCFVGLAMVSAGLWLVHPSAMLCVVGSGLIVGGVFAYRVNKRPTGGKPQ